MHHIPEITTEELQNAINKLKKGKSPDNKGIRAEEIKDCDEETREMMRQIFNEVIKKKEFTPEDWKKVTIKVIHKKGDVENVSNYRPICSLPALYKLFSTILYGRLYPVLDQKQAEDQAGFRKSYQTTDHLATYRLIEQKCHEWGIKMWTATVDFTKAFDSISHKSIWEALKSCNIDHEHISLLRKIYRDQKASVQTDEESYIVDIQKGSKQGDPLSSLLFNSPSILSEGRNSTMAKEKRMGIHLTDHDHDCLTNLRFADDVMLFATSKEQIRKFMCEFKKATEKVGLRIHPDKTNILSNQSTIISDKNKAPSSRWHEHRNIDKKRKREIFGSENLVLLTRNDGNQEPYQGCMGDLPQIQTRVDIKKITNIVYGYSTPQFLRLFATQRELGHQTTRENDPIDATQDATTHYPEKKEIQKD